MLYNPTLKTYNKGKTLLLLRNKSIHKKYNFSMKIHKKPMKYTN